MTLKNQVVISKTTGMKGYIVRAKLDKLYITFTNGDRIGVNLYNYKKLIHVDPEIEKYLDKKLRKLLSSE